MVAVATQNHRQSRLKPTWEAPALSRRPEGHLAEQCFRFNNRGTKDEPMHDGDRFTKALAQVDGKRLTWKELTGKEAASGAA